MLRFKRRNGENYPDWRKVSFGDIIEEFSEKTKIENEQVLLSSAIEGVFLNSELFGHQRGSSNIGYKKIKKGTLILSTQNLHLGNANVNMRFGEGIVSPAYKTYNIIGCNVKFMDIWIKREETKKFFYNSTTVGASACRRNVEWDSLYSSHIYLPCEKEQQKIADFFSKVDEKISNQEAVISDYEEMKKGLMQKIFSQEVRFKADDGSEYPKWENKKWGSIGQFMKSGNLAKSDLTENGNPCILYGELYTKYKEIANTIYSKTNTPCEVVSKKGDVILPKSGETPEDISTATCIPYDGVALGGDLIIFRSTCILGSYLSYLISNQKKWEIAKIAQGKTIAHISEKSLAKIDIEVPCYEEQQKIADCLSAMDRKIEAEKKILEDWKELKKALLQQMFV